MLRSLMLLTGLALSTPAMAEIVNLDALPGISITSSNSTTGCPWEEGITSANASMTTVYINGVPYLVKGYEARSRFLYYLQTCGHPDAAVAFELWRQDRRWTNTTAIVGILPALQPAWIGTIVFAVRAGEHKHQMLDALNY